MRKLSKKRSNEMATYRRLAKQFLEGNPDCIVCRGNATEVHHIRGRAGKMLLLMKWWLPVCHICHETIHSHPAWAQEHQWLAANGEWLKP